MSNGLRFRVRKTFWQVISQTVWHTSISDEPSARRLNSDLIVACGQQTFRRVPAGIVIFNRLSHCLRAFNPLNVSGTRTKHIKIILFDEECILSKPHCLIIPVKTAPPSIQETLFRKFYTLLKQPNFSSHGANSIELNYIMNIVLLSRDAR